MSSVLPLWKKIVFSMALAVLLVVVIEVSLILAGYHGPQSDVYDNFVPHRSLFGESGPLLKLQTGFFHHQTITKIKAQGKKRVFVFGGSLTYGYQLANPLHESYPAVLRTMLDSNRVEMVNIGGIGYASYRLVDLVRECLNYEPDLLIIMCGHNEFLEARHYGKIRKYPWERLRCVQFLEAAGERLGLRGKGKRDSSISMSEEYRGQRYIERDAEEVQLTLDHYKWNLGRMADLCREKGVPVILCTEPSNLRDSPPFVTNESRRIKEYQGISLRWKIPVLMKRWLQDIKDGHADQVYKVAQEALAKDNGLAVFHYLAAKALDSLGKTTEAREHFIKARDLDGFPHRAPSSFNKAVRKIAQDKGVGFYDAEKVLADASPGGISGNNLFVDQSHPTAEGHRKIAEGLSHIARPLLRL